MHRVLILKHQNHLNPYTLCNRHKHSTYSNLFLRWLLSSDPPKLYQWCNSQQGRFGSCTLWRSWTFSSWPSLNLLRPSVKSSFLGKWRLQNMHQDMAVPNRTKDFHTGDDAVFLIVPSIPDVMSTSISASQGEWMTITTSRIAFFRLTIIRFTCEALLP